VRTDQDLGQVVVGNVGQLFPVEFGYHQLSNTDEPWAVSRQGPHRGVAPTACPRLRGLISRKASVLSLSYSLKQGISPSRGSDHRRSTKWEDDMPLIILQNMQDAILLDIRLWKPEEGVEGRETACAQLVRAASRIN